MLDPHQTSGEPNQAIAASAESLDIDADDAETMFREAMCGGIRVAATGPSAAGDGS
jgi:hypothetical protein